MMFFLKYFALILIYFIIGHGILRLFRIKVPISSFVQYFAWSAGLGFIYSSVIIALIFSYGKTIALAAILPLAWFIYSLKKDENISNQQNLKLDFDLKEILLFIIFMVLLYIFYFNNVFYYDSYKDSIFRANLSNLMIYTNFKEFIISRYFSAIFSWVKLFITYSNPFSPMASAISLFSNR